jgi:ribose transport system ATP-binding protein
MDSDQVIRMNGIEVQFGGVSILKAANFDIIRGEIHALLGENGAGKSSLMKVLSGNYKKTSGVIELHGKEVEFNQPLDAINAGISFIPQELQLAPHLTVAENIFLGREIFRKSMPGVLDKSAMREKTVQYLKDLAPEISPDDVVGSLGVAKQQMVAIAKALSTDAKVIIMDESTTALTDSEVERFFETVLDLKARGVSIILITHRLEEVFQLADRATVMRDGETVGTVLIKDMTTDKLIELMVGRELEDIFPKVITKRGDEGIRVEGLTGGLLKDISFTAYRGEVLGLAGLMGSGRTEVLRMLCGADPIRAGEIYVDGKRVRIRNCRDAIRHKIAYLTEDRKGNGLALHLDVTENIVMPSFDRLSTFGVIRRSEMLSIAKKYIKELSIKVKGPSFPVQFLSGGNQQKVMLSKWLATDPEIILLDEPTRGIDVQTKVEVYNLINRLTEEGKTVIMTSSYLPELMAMSDRYIVLCEGRITGELSREEATAEKILHYASMYKQESQVL